MGRGRMSFLASGLAVAIISVIASVAVAESRSYDSGLHAYRQGQVQSALDIWRPLARAGDARAQFGVGLILERGRAGQAPTPEKAAKWYQKAAAQGNADAQTNLGHLYAAGRGVEQSQARALGLWQKAGAQGHAVAQYNLALAYYQGRGVTRSPRKVLYWMRRAAQQGLIEAQYRLAQIYETGLDAERADGISPNRERALAWYRHAAKGGHRMARDKATALAGAVMDNAPASGLSQRKANSAPRYGTREQEVARKSYAKGQAVSQTGRAIDRSEPAGAGAPETTVGRRASGRYALWLGSSENRTIARATWEDLRHRYNRILAPYGARFDRANPNDPAGLVRILVGGFARMSQADAVCADLTKADRARFCRVVLVR